MITAEQVRERAETKFGKKAKLAIFLVKNGGVVIRYSRLVRKTPFLPPKLVVTRYIEFEKESYPLREWEFHILLRCGYIVQDKEDYTTYRWNKEQ